MTNELIIINEEYIKDKIYIIRGKQVMIDSDLAKIYGYSTKAFNQQVQRNIERFDDDFRFELTGEEVQYLSRSQNVTTMQTKGIKGGRVYNPYAFTEEGIYMLMTVLKGDLAVKQSKALIKIFKSMKDFLIENKILEQKYINNMVLEHDESIKYLKETFNTIKDNKKDNEIYFNGQIYDAYSKIQQILNEANKEITIIDTYADNAILDMIKRLKVKVIIITKKDQYITNQDIEKYNQQYNNLKVLYDNTFHDRYFIIDNKQVYHCGASINRIGYKTFCINKINDKEIISTLLNKIKSYSSVKENVK